MSTPADQVAAAVVPKPAVAAAAVVPAAAKSDLDQLRADFASLETHVKNAVESRLSALETDATSEVTKVKAWFKAEWPHVVTWLGSYGTGLLLALKALGKI